MADTATVSAIQARQHACNSLTMRHVRWADSAALGDYIRPGILRGVIGFKAMAAHIAVICVPRAA